MAVAGESEVERKLTEVAVTVFEPGQRRPQPQLVAVLVDRRSRHPPEHAAQVKHRDVENPRNFCQRQGVRVPAAEELAGLVGELDGGGFLPRFGSTAFAVGMRQHVIEESHDALVQVERVQFLRYAQPR